MRWGDAFAGRVPSWAEYLTPDCNCKDVRRKMNELREPEARLLFDDFAQAVHNNAKKSKLMSALPDSSLEAEIKRRMALAFEDAFGVEL